MSNSHASTTEVVTGAAFGLLTGLFVGMSASPIVGAVIGPVLAIAAAVLGLKPASAEASAQLPVGTPAVQRQACAFALACLLAALAGVWMRTHDSLGMPLKAQVAELTAAGLSNEQAREIIILRETGISPDRGATSDPSPKKETENKTASAPLPIRSSVLFADQHSRLDALEPGRFGDANKMLQAYRHAGGSAERLANQVETSVPEAERAKLLQQVWEFSTAQQ